MPRVVRFFINASLCVVKILSFVFKGPATSQLNLGSVGMPGKTVREEEFGPGSPDLFITIDL